MIGLFRCRILYNMIRVLVPSPMNLAVYGALAVLAQFLFIKEIWLPQSLDVAMFGTTLMPRAVCSGSIMSCTGSISCRSQ